MPCDAYSIGWSHAALKHPLLLHKIHLGRGGSVVRQAVLVHTNPLLHDVPNCHELQNSYELYEALLSVDCGS